MSVGGLLISFTEALNPQVDKSLNLWCMASEIWSAPCAKFHIHPYNVLPL